MLTQKQEDFKNDLFAGIPQRDAYMNHYNTQNMLPATIDKAAYELANNPKISSSLEELRQGVKSDLIADVGERKAKLTEVLRDSHKLPLTAREKVYAIAELNKMEHVYEESNIRDINVVFIIGKGYKDAIQRQGESQVSQQGKDEETSVTP